MIMIMAHNPLGFVQLLTIEIRQGCGVYKGHENGIFTHSYLRLWHGVTVKAWIELLLHSDWISGQSRDPEIVIGG